MQQLRQAFHRFRNTMLGFIVWRLIQSLLILFVVISILFSLVSIMPGNICHDKLTDEQCEKLETAYGLRGPFGERYGKFMTGVPKGDLGASAKVQPNVPVSQIISEKLPISISVGVLPLIFGSVVGVVLGILAALRHNKFTDTFITFLTVIFVSVPSFVFAFVLQYVYTGVSIPFTMDVMVKFILLFISTVVVALIQIFNKQKTEKKSIVAVTATSVAFGLLVFFTAASIGGELKLFPIVFDKTDGLSYMLPMLALSFFVIATVTRYVRAEMLEVLNSDYILLAKAKGVNNFRLYFVHAIRNALIPAITVIAPLALTLLTGSIVIERVFAIPGMGNLLVDGIAAKDNNVILGVGVVYTIIYSLIFLAIDVAYGLIDPRVRVGGGN